VVVQGHAPAALNLAKEIRYPINRRPGGPQGHRMGEENLAPTGIGFAGRPCHSESLYRLSYHSPQKRKFIGVK